MKISFRPNLIAALRAAHSLVVALLIAGCIYLGVQLYDRFYLPYNLEDTPVTPAAAEAESPASRSVLHAAEQLRLRLATGTASHLPDVFWPTEASTSTAR